MGLFNLNNVKRTGPCHGIETMAFVGATPWHGLGTFVGDKATTAEQMMRLAGLDWSVEGASMFLANGGNPVTDFKVLIRSSDQAQLSVVTDTYNILQPSEIFSILDDVVHEGAAFHTAGSLWGGKQIWAMVEIGQHEPVKEDKIKKFLIIWSSFDMSMPTHFFTSEVRVVCNNTARAALSKATEKYTIRHTKNQRKRLDIVGALFKRANETFDTSAEFQAALAKANMNHQMWEKFAFSLIPDPKGSKKSKKTQSEDEPISIERAKAKRELLEECLVNSLGQDIPTGIAGCLVRDTLYGARCAVTNYCNFQKQTRDQDGQGQARRFESSLHGSSALLIQKADELLEEMLQAA